jgi:carbon storage regulator CsrA
MLVLSRRPRETISFPGIGITVYVLTVKRGSVRLGIEAPPEVIVLRGELKQPPTSEAPAAPPSVKTQAPLRLVRHLTLFGLLLLPALFLTGCGEKTREAGPVDGKHDAAVQETKKSAAPAPAPPAKTAKAAPAAEPNQVEIDNFAFSPRQLTVTVGTKVSWVNRDDVPHTATSTSKPRAFHSGTLDTDDTFSHVFQTPGTYEYFCAVHPNMTGKIIVK